MVFFVAGVTASQLGSRSSGFFQFQSEKAVIRPSATRNPKTQFSVSAVTMPADISVQKDNRGRVLHQFFEKTENQYWIRTPTAKRVIDALAKVNEFPRNDHIAFRTFSYPGLGRSSLESLFLESGFEKQEELYFPEKHLKANWYKPPVPEMERVFISELQLDELSPNAQAIIAKYLKDTDPAVKQFAILSALMEERPWPTPTEEDYKALAAESEYASWTLLNAYAFNHVTVAIHDLKELNTIEKLNQFLKDSGFLMNNSGGEIKTSKDGLLRQSSTVADMVKATFADGTTKDVAGSYMEFAERGVLPQFQGLAASEISEKHRRDGFEVANADKIFESTYEAQLKRK